VRSERSAGPRIHAATIVLLIAGCTGPLPPPPAATGPAADLAARLAGPTPMEEDLRHLGDRIGGRPTGSPALERSIDWFLGRFKEAGVDLAWTEEFTVPIAWEEDHVAARVVAPDPFRVELVAMPYCGATPPGGIEADVVPVGAGDEAGFKAAGARARGAILLVETKVLATWEDLFTDYLNMPPFIGRARAAGAAAVVFVGARPHRLLYRHIAAFEPVPLPMAVLAREDGLRIARLAGAGPVRMFLDLAVRQGPAFRARNVLAEIRGREQPDEVVLAGAHLDSWDLGTGVLDNGANCVMLLDIARQIAAVGSRPRRSIRFALFTGEEQGMFGSLGYARTHAAELDRHAAVAVFDTGTGRFTGFSLGGRADLKEVVEAALRGHAGERPLEHTTDAFVGTDNFDFLLEGVPNLVANQEPAGYLENYHASSDTFEKADLHALRSNAALAAALVWGLADAPGRAPRQDRAAIDDVLGQTGLADQMRTFGLWDAWENGDRGRAGARP
jgi:hypothetical protein